MKVFQMVILLCAFFECILNVCLVTGVLSCWTFVQNHILVGSYWMILNTISFLAVSSQQFAVDRTTWKY